MDLIERLVNVVGGLILGAYLPLLAFFTIALGVRGLDRLWFWWRGKGSGSAPG